MYSNRNRQKCTEHVKYIIRSMKIIHIDPGLASQQFNQSCLEDVTVVMAFTAFCAEWVSKWLKFHYCCNWQLMQNEPEQAKKKGWPVFRGGTKPSFCFNGEIVLPEVADDPPRNLWALDSHTTCFPSIWQIYINWIFILYGSDPRYQYPLTPYSQGTKRERWKSFVPSHGL